MNKSRCSLISEDQLVDFSLHSDYGGDDSDEFESDYYPESNVSSESSDLASEISDSDDSSLPNTSSSMPSASRKRARTSH